MHRLACFLKNMGTVSQTGNREKDHNKEARNTGIQISGFGVFRKFVDNKI